MAGEPVTPAQAEQILIRTDQLELACSDRSWSDAAHRILTGTAHPDSHGAVEDRLAAVRAQLAARRRYGFLWLPYLGNRRIAWPARGTNGSWCDWDGTLGACAYPIGKWPDEDAITRDWMATPVTEPEHASFRDQVADETRTVFWVRVEPAADPKRDAEPHSPPPSRRRSPICW